MSLIINIRAQFSTFIEDSATIPSYKFGKFDNLDINDINHVNTDLILSW